MTSTMSITKEVRAMFADLKGRTTVVIDGSNLYHTGLSLGLKIDFKLLRELLNNILTVNRIHYFTTRPYIDPAVEKDRLRPLLDWLSYNGYAVHEHKSHARQNSRFLRTNAMTADVCITAFKALESGVDNIVLFTGDGDYTQLVELLKEGGVRVCVVSSTKPTKTASNTNLSIVSDPLRRAADVFVEIASIASLFSVPLENRNIPPSELINEEASDDEVDSFVDDEVDDEVDVEDVDDEVDVEDVDDDDAISDVDDEETTRPVMEKSEA